MGALTISTAFALADIKYEATLSGSEQVPAVSTQMTGEIHVDYDEDNKVVFTQMYIHSRTLVVRSKDNFTYDTGRERLADVHGFFQELKEKILALFRSAR